MFPRMTIGQIRFLGLCIFTGLIVILAGGAAAICGVIYLLYRGVRAIIGA